MAIKREKKEEEDGGNPFQSLDKTSVLQDARTFNETPVEPRKCTPIITKILYLINQGEQLGPAEATDTFFAVTKLFQSNNTLLRRLVYLCIKELSTTAQDVIIVTSSLTKDMTGKEDLYRAAAIRALCSITDGTMLQTIERYMKQAIVDRNPSVASAALVSSLHMSRIAGDVVKRWVNEAQEAVNSDSVMVQYHAMGLLYHIRKNDRLAVTKLVSKFTRSSLKSPFAVCMLIRIACKLLEEESSGEYADSPLFDFVEACLRHKSETVVYEAAAALVNLRQTTARQIGPAVSVLQLFCSSPKPALRFAAVRTLNKVAMTHPATVTSCNFDLENLITDSNRSIATLAITTLLKTGAESAVDRLMKQIASFVSEISDEFKIVVVQAIRALCLKFPRKHSTLMTFLSAMLRDEGGLEYKASIADTLISLIEGNPEAKESGLAHLCEFIEDCEHTSLAVRILHLLGKEGPKTKQPSRYIRFIYNRVILENAVVRAAAVSALAQFGASCPDLLENILVLLARCQMDTDDEVRDRATYYYCILKLQDRGLINNYIIDPPQVCVSSLEKALLLQLSDRPTEAFDLSLVPLAPPTVGLLSSADEATKTAAASVSTGGLLQQEPLSGLLSGRGKEESIMERLKSIPELSALPGPLFKSSEAFGLTESETEYQVRVIKHVLRNHLVLQFDCTNTMTDQILEQVRVQLEPSEGWEIVAEVPCPRLACSETSPTYIALQFPQEFPLTVTNFGATLRFIVKECDPMTGIPVSDDGYEEDYMLEDVEMSLADQLQRLTKSNFGAAWEEAESWVQLEDTYNLSALGSIDEAVKSVVQFLGMQPADRSDRPQPDKNSHTLYLAGMFRGGVEVLARAKLVVGNSPGVAMQLTVRCPHPDIADLIISVVG